MPKVRVLATSSRTQPEESVTFTFYHVSYDSKSKLYTLKIKETVSGVVKYQKGGVYFNGKRLSKPKAKKGSRLPRMYYLASSSLGIVGEAFLKSRLEKLKTFNAGTKFKRDGTVVIK